MSGNVHVIECCDHRGSCVNKNCRCVAIPKGLEEDDKAYADAEVCKQYRSPEGHEAEKQDGTDVVLVGVWKGPITKSA